MLSSSTELDVMMGERRPEVGKVRTEEEEKSNHCNGSWIIWIMWIISYELCHMDHIMWIISYGSYPMDHIIYGLYHMDHIIWIISYGTYG